MEGGVELNLQENENDNSHLSVFVHHANSYVGRHLVSALKDAHYTVYGNTKARSPFCAPDFTPEVEFEEVNSIDEAFALCNTFIFDIRENPDLALQAFSRFESVTTNVKIILISTLMTWALTSSPSRSSTSATSTTSPDAHNHHSHNNSKENNSKDNKENSKETSSKEKDKSKDKDKDSTQNQFQQTPPPPPLTGDDFRKRKPHPNFQRQYETELQATKLCRENPLVDVFVLSCGIPYGDGEELLFQLFKFAWCQRFNESLGLREARGGIPLIGRGDNIVPMIHVRDLSQLLISTLQGQMIDKYVMGVDKGNCRLRDIIESISKTFSDGQITEYELDQALTIPWISEELIDYLTSDIIAVNELLGRVKTTNSEGFVSSIENIKDEFIEHRGISPLRILVCGPPLSGKTYVSSRISYRYSIPLVTVDSLVSEAKKNEHNYWNQFQSQINGEISPNLLLDLLKWKLNDIPCRNQGFVLDGIPSNGDFAEALWSDGENLPQIFLELESDDSFLRERAKHDPSMMLGIGNTEEFEARLQQYRNTNPHDDSHLFYSLDHLNIRGLTINVEKYHDNLVPRLSKFIGRAHNFGKTPSLVLRDTEELNRQKRLKQERLLKMEKEIREAEERKKREKEEQLQRQQEEIEQEETRLLAKFSKPQREWLVSTVAPTLAEGLCFLIGEMPEDPIQLLGCFIGTQLPPEQQAELMNEFQPEEEEDYEEEEEQANEN